jgi:hypothetical protein
MDGLFYVDYWSEINDEPLVAVNIKEKEVEKNAIYERLKAALRKLTINSKDIVIISNLDNDFFEEKEIKEVINFFKIKIEKPSEDYLSYLING